LGAPRIGVGQEEVLKLGKPVGAFVVEGLALLIQRIGQRDQSQVDAAVVGGIFTLGQQAVLLHTGFGNFLGIFIGDALASLLIVLCVGFLAPVAEVAVGVKLASLIVKTVRDLVADHAAFRTIIGGIALISVEERRLKDSRGKVDGIGLRIVVRVD